MVSATSLGRAEAFWGPVWAGQLQSEPWVRFVSGSLASHNWIFQKNLDVQSLSLCLFFWNHLEVVGWFEYSKRCRFSVLAIKLIGRFLACRLSMTFCIFLSLSMFKPPWSRLDPFGSSLMGSETSEAAPNPFFYFFLPVSGVSKARWPSTWRRLPKYYTMIKSSGSLLSNILRGFLHLPPDQCHGQLSSHALKNQNIKSHSGSPSPSDVRIFKG